MVARRACWLLLGVLATLACRPQVALLRGVAELGDRLLLPPGAQLEVDFLELRPGMAPAVVERRHLTPEAWPAEFDLDIDRLDLAEGASYALVARVRLEERVVYASQEPVPIDPAAPRRRVRLLLVRQR
jgi:uncharacterized lipoprotein YbaY